MIAVEVEAEAWREALPDVEAVVVRAAEAALPPLAAGPGQAVRQRPEPDGRAGCDITLLLADDLAVRDLNARFRGRDASTNVLSFPAPASARPHLGDIALAYGVCAREAEDQGKDLGSHLSHLVVHGVLHLLGYDHEIESEAEKMESLERSVMAGLGLADPYEDPGGSARHA